MTTTLERMELPNHIRISYVEQGDPSGIPVLFLHGYTDSWRSFEGVLRHLPRSIHAFALSQRGHGDSDRPQAGYGPRDFAADLAAFMDAHELPSAVIAGHCLGGYVAQRFALDYPERTLGLVLLGSYTTLRGNTAVAELWDVVSTLTDPADPDFVREFQQSTLAQPTPPGFLDTVVQESLKLPARVWRAVMLEAILRADHSGELGRIAVPTLIAWGDQDGLVSRSELETLATAVRGSRLLVYDGAGHALHWEEPARVAADLTAFATDLLR
ncbi:MAG TPA: alpha/beta hydrolase [Azospirillum sp.]|nr:alpha/beta hydrolase [Azospirillum sp.]